MNYDCLREIFKHLDLISQLSVIISCETFKPIVLHDLRNSYYAYGFDFSHTPSISLQTKDFQGDALKVILRTFNKAKNVPLEIFNKSLEETKTEIFEEVQYISMADHNHGKQGETLNTQHFCRFPNLVKLKLGQVSIHFSCEDTFHELKRLFLDNCTVLDDEEGNFLQSIFSANMKTILLESLKIERINPENFNVISRCVNLKELSIATEFISDSRILDMLVELPALEILTLQSKNCFYFDCRDHCIFERLLKTVQEYPKKDLEGIQMNGMPNQCFFYSESLKRIEVLNWMVDQIFHRITNGCTQWTNDLPLVILSFYHLIENNQHLQTLYVRDNLYHMVKLHRHSSFNEKLHKSRAKLNYPRLNIVTDYKNLPKNPYIIDLKKGFMKFIFKLIS